MNTISLTSRRIVIWVWLLTLLGCVVTAVTIPVGWGVVPGVGDADAHPWTPSGSEIAEDRIVTVAFVMDPGVLHHIAAFNELVHGSTPADDIVVLGQDCAFAWDEVRRQHPSDAFDQGLHQWRSSRHSSFAISDSVASRPLALFRCDFAAVIPPRATIIDAELHVCPANPMYVPRSDSLVAVLMSQPGDTCWYRPSALGVPQYGLQFMAHASWSRQVQGLDSGGWSDRGYPAVSGETWEPALSTRRYVWDWGQYWDYSRRPDDVASTSIDTVWTNYYPYHHVRITISNCVQAIVNGAVNNGIMWYGFGRASTAPHSVVAWETSTPEAGNPAEASVAPWITVTYSTASYEAPYPRDARWAMVFSTDDGYAVNAQYDSIFAPFDYRFTIGLEQFRVDRPGRLTSAQLVELHDHGNEIATHGYHPPEYAGQPTPDGAGVISANFEGFNHYTQGSDLRNWYKGAPHFVLALPGTTSFDSTCFQMDPVWLDSLAIAKGRVDLLDSPRWGVGLHVPNAGYSIDMLRAIPEVGLTWVRTLPAAAVYNPTSGYMEYRRIASTHASAPGYAAADSAFLGRPHDQRLSPGNLRIFPTTCDLRDIFGARDTRYSESGVKHNLRRQIAKIKGNGQGVIAVVTHRQKSAAQDGLDLQEAKWMAEVVSEMGGTMITWGEYAATARAYAKPIATPSGYRQSPLYRMHASKKQWYVNQYPFRYMDDDHGVSGVSPTAGGAVLLGAAYPNPFNPLTTIRFSQDRPGVVRVAVYDVRGRLVRELAAGGVAAGQHELVWDGRDDSGRPVASGTYLCRLTAGDITRTSKLALVR